ncbi:MAG: hypothetical protein AAGG02_17530 [Cyanobacteria bacterium P01_H01_bin.15]
MKDAHGMSDQIGSIFLDFSEKAKSIQDGNPLEQVSSFIDSISDIDLDQSKSRMVIGWLSSLAAVAYRKYVERVPLEELVHVRKNFMDTLLNRDVAFLNLDGPIICGKQQPSFSKSVIPTLDRMEALKKFIHSCSSSFLGVILGGSLSYIPFLGIREDFEASDHSDVDLLVIVDQAFFNEGHPNQQAFERIFVSEDVKIFAQRKLIFSALFSGNRADVFSHRFRIRGYPFSFSIHFLEQGAFERRFVHHPIQAIELQSDISTTLIDYRQNTARHPCLARHSFDGSRLESSHENFPTELGGLMELPVFDIEQARFYPGPLLTVISPTFDVVYDRKGSIKRDVLSLKRSMENAAENTHYRHPFSSIGLAHNRSDIFPPGSFGPLGQKRLAPKDLAKSQAYEAAQISDETKGSIKQFNTSMSALVNISKLDLHPDSVVKKLTTVCQFPSTEAEPAQFVPNLIMRQHAYRSLSLLLPKVFIQSKWKNQGSSAKDQLFYEIVPAE